MGDFPWLTPPPKCMVSMPCVTGGEMMPHRGWNIWTGIICTQSALATLYLHCIRYRLRVLPVHHVTSSGSRHAKQNYPWIPMKLQPQPINRSCLPPWSNTRPSSGACRVESSIECRCCLQEILYLTHNYQLHNEWVIWIRKVVAFIQAIYEGLQEPARLFGLSLSTLPQSPATWIPRQFARIASCL